MATHSSELEIVLRKYIDSLGKEGRDRLRDLLKNKSVKTKYELLMNLKGVEYSTFTGLHSAAFANDLKIIKYMLNGFSSSQKYDVVKIQERVKYTALYTAAHKGYTSIINYLLSNLSQPQKYDLLKIQTQNGDTALHGAAINENEEAVKAIISSVSSHLLIQLFSVKNSKGETVTDIRPELYDELRVLMGQGIVLI